MVSITLPSPALLSKDKISFKDLSSFALLLAREAPHR